jgi:hypothetical protein
MPFPRRLPESGPRTRLLHLAVSCCRVLEVERGTNLRLTSGCQGSAPVASAGRPGLPHQSAFVKATGGARLILHSTGRAATGFERIVAGPSVWSEVMVAIKPWQLLICLIVVLAIGGAVARAISVGRRKYRRAGSPVPARAGSACQGDASSLISACEFRSHFLGQSRTSPSAGVQSRDDFVRVGGVNLRAPDNGLAVARRQGKETGVGWRSRVVQSRRGDDCGVR